MRKRSGASLAELIVVISIGAVVASLTLASVSLMLRAELATRQGGVNDQQLSRLAQRFRSDAASAEAVASNPESGAVEFLQAEIDRKIVYSATEHGVRRFAMHEGHAVHRDSFPLVKAAVALSVEDLPSSTEEKPLRLAVLEVTLPGDDSQPAYARRIEAAVHPAEGAQP